MAESVPPSNTETDSRQSPGVNLKMRHRLWECQKKGEFCDVVLETDVGDRFLAHRVVVASGSPLLHSMLVDPNICNKDEQSGMQMLKLPEVSKQSLQDLIRFSYVGEVEQISMETVSLWERFQIYEPIILCEEAPNIKAAQEQETSVPAEETKTVEKMPEIKSEHDSSSVDEDIADMEDWDDPNDSDYEEEKPKRRKSTTHQTTSDKNKDGNLEEGSSEPMSRRKRKCSSPKHVKTKEEVTGDDDMPEDNVPIKTLLKRKRGRPKQKEPLDNMDEDTEIDEDYKPIPVKTKKKLKMKKPKKEPPEKEKKIAKPPSTPLTHCKSCNVGFDTVEEYRQHRQSMHKGRHKCLECGATFNRVNRLKAHRIASHPQEGLPEPTWHHCKAEGCDYKSVYTDVLDLHYKSVHAKERSICETCGAVFSRPYYLTLHRRRAHGGVGKTYKCDECEVLFYLPCELKLHKERVHEKSKRFLCDQCPFSSFDKYSVSIHMFSKHNVPLPGSRTTYDCPYCDYKSHTKTIITAHIERHGEETFKCNLCDSVFRCNRDLKSHYRMRHSQKPKVIHRCPYEGCKYASIYGPTPLKNHISRMHENKDYKPFGCDVCNYRTNVKGNLHLHIRKVHRLQPHIQQHRVKKCVQPEKEDQPLPEFLKLDTDPNLNPTLVLNPPNPIPNQNPEPVQEGFQVCPPTTYQDIAKTETAPVEVPPTYHTLSAAETMPNRLPAGVPVMAGTQFGLMIPNFGYDESLYTRPPANQMN